MDVGLPSLENKITATKTRKQKQKSRFAAGFFMLQDIRYGYRLKPQNRLA